MSLWFFFELMLIEWEAIYFWDGRDSELLIDRTSQLSSQVLSFSHQFPSNSNDLFKELHSALSDIITMINML